MKTLLQEIKQLFKNSGNHYLSALEIYEGLKSNGKIVSPISVKRRINEVCDKGEGSIFEFIKVGRYHKYKLIQK